MGFSVRDESASGPGRIRDFHHGLLARFRKDNQLHRSPDYPKSGWKFFWYGLTALLLVIESSANAGFLAQGLSDGGILSAFNIALGISFANIIPSFFFFGPYSRNFQHVRPVQRVLAGFVTLVVYIPWLLILNLGVAHYREVSGQLIGDGGLQVVQRMTEEPLGLQDAQSWLLFAIGLIFSLIAFFDGWKLDDAYPGYGKMDRLRQSAHDQHSDEKISIVGELEEILLNSLDDVHKTASDAMKQPQEHKRIVGNWRTLCDEFESHVKHLQEVGSTLIDEYREANRIARPDGRVPRAHQNPWRMPEESMREHKSKLDGFHADSGKPTDDEIHRAHGSATNEIHALHKTVGKDLFGGKEPGATDSEKPSSPSRHAG